MKTKEELNELRKEVESLNKKLRELTDEELSQVSGGVETGFRYVVDIPILNEITGTEP